MPAKINSNSNGWHLDNSYARLPGNLFTRLAPTPVAHPRMVVFNRSLARDMGLDAESLDSESGADIFAGNVMVEGSEPLAMAYAGHQFGQFTFLGDGRAILLGEQLTPDGRKLDIHLKGSGRTPYSRNGDGRAALGPMLREYLISEAMWALHIPTTRSLAVVATGEPVLREKALAGAVLTRIASSHIRVGTFEYAAARGDIDSLRALTEYTLHRHFQNTHGAASPASALLISVLELQASLVARWMLSGFVHGVMNTDNMAISGETLDYGPCAFMDAYNPATVFSSIDRQGRYAYGNQPGITLWNLTRFAQALLPLLHQNSRVAKELALGILDSFQGKFERHLQDGLKKKLALFSEEGEDDRLIEDLFSWMYSQQADFTNTFAALCQEASLHQSSFADPAFLAWHQRWKERLLRQELAPAQALEHARRQNPAVIPRNHLVEEALRQAVDNNNMEPFVRLHQTLLSPFDHDHTPEDFRKPAPGDQSNYHTFCGT